MGRVTAVAVGRGEPLRRKKDEKIFVFEYGSSRSDDDDRSRECVRPMRHHTRLRGLGLYG